MRFALNLLGLAATTSAHTLFTTFFVNGENQGDGTCVRLPEDGKTATSPIYPLDGEPMACGPQGDTAAPYICPSPAGATLTFEFRAWPNLENPGSIDDSHQGPCSVYLKKVDDMFSDSASGPGWFKVWEDGYHPETDDWCVDTLIANDGRLSVELPSGLPSGYYLVRPELLALHLANKGDPQFYHSCAQIFIEEGPEGSLDIPSNNSVSIPGYLEKDDPGLTFNLYADDPNNYIIPGPEVFIPSFSGTGTKATQSDGKIPENCLIKNGNWCAKPVPKSSDLESCWDSVDDCWAQSEKCWDAYPVTGGVGCETWGDYCTQLGDNCDAEQFDGPAEFTGKEHFGSNPKSMPKVYNDDFKRTEVGSGSGSDSNESDSGSDTETDTDTGNQPGTIIDVPKEDEKDSEEPSAVVKPQPVETSEPVTEEKEESTGGLKISEDGRCGGETGQTCIGSSFGDCCSKKGRCGRKTRHCTCGCQSDFGECRK